MIVFVLTREIGCYSDYGRDLLGVYKTPERARKAAELFEEQRYEQETRGVAERRAVWPEVSEQARNIGIEESFWDRTAEEVYPDPEKPVIEWNEDGDYGKLPEHGRWYNESYSIDAIGLDQEPHAT